MLHRVGVKLVKEDLQTLQHWVVLFTGVHDNEINDIVNQLIREVALHNWRYFDKPRRFTGTDYGSQKGWERVDEGCEDLFADTGFRQISVGEYNPFQNGPCDSIDPSS